MQLNKARSQVEKSLFEETDYVKQAVEDVKTFISCCRNWSSPSKFLYYRSRLTPDLEEVLKDLTSSSNSVSFLLFSNQVKDLYYSRLCANLKNKKNLESLQNLNLKRPANANAKRCQQIIEACIKKSAVVRNKQITNLTKSKHYSELVSLQKSIGSVIKGLDQYKTETNPSVTDAQNSHNV